MAVGSEYVPMNTNGIAVNTSMTRHGPGSGRSVRRVAAGIVLGLVIALAGCSSGPASAPAMTGGSAAHAGAKASIAITNFMFVPSHLSVLPGATVTVVNRDQVAHTVSSSTGGFDTGSVAPGASMTFTAPNHSGSFPYICSIHQYMSGTLTVT